MERILSRLAISGIALLFTLGVLEVGLRLFRPVYYMEPLKELPESDQSKYLVRRSEIPGMEFELVPNGVKPVQGFPAKINSVGMRCHEPLPAGAPGAYRIAAVGDSVTFGYGVDQQSAWPAVLEEELNGKPWDAANPGRFEVLNFGVPGYNTVQEAAVVHYKVMPLRPRLIILAYVLNDPDILHETPLNRVFTPARWWQHFHVLRMMAKAELACEIRWYGKGNEVFFYHATGRPGWESVVHGFGRIRADAASAQAKVLVVIFPMFNYEAKDWASYKYSSLHRQVSNLARSQGFEVLDLFPSISRYPPPSVSIPASATHPNVLGDKVAAAEIEKKVLELASQQ